MKLFLQLDLRHWQKADYEKPMLAFASSFSSDVIGAELDNQSEASIVDLVVKLCTQAQQVFVLVTLKGGSQIGGLMGAASFASSDSNERDLLIEEVWTINDFKEWTRPEPSRSALLCGNNIDYIEFFEGDSDA